MKTIWNLLDQFGLQRVNIQSERTQYRGFFVAGEFTNALFDYDAGIFQMQIVSYPLFVERMYEPFMTISTVDDGAWQADTQNMMSLDKSNQIVEQIADKWPIKWASKLPSEDELNKFLSNFGMFGKFTG